MEGRKHHAAIALGILLSGEPILVGEEQYWYQDGVFGVRRERHLQDGTKEEIVLGVDMTVAGFIKWCEKFPPEVLLNSVFNKVLREKRSGRL